MPKKTKKKQSGKGPKTRRRLKKANDFLRKTKLISRVGGVLSNVGLPYAGSISRVAGQAGYGRKVVRF